VAERPLIGAPSTTGTKGGARHWRAAQNGINNRDERGGSALAGSAKRHRCRSAGAFFWSMSRVRLCRRHRTGKLPVFLRAAATKTLPPKRGFKRPKIFGKGAEAWKTGTRSGGCFWLEDFCSV
jgi:hypothetical protein